MSKSDAPKIVTALFSFKGKNNDELCFRKGDVITVTQTVDGGWWEGTLNDKTAWFPSNYVKECQSTDTTRSSVKSSPEKSQESPVKDQRINRDIVLKDLVDSEKANVAELQGLATNFLQPLESANILSKKEYKQLIGNVYDVLEAHQRLLSNLEATVSQGPDARVGNLFLMLAPRLKAVHTAYCAGHPQAVCILDRYRDELNEFMERSGAVTPGILVMTTGLSKPFRRLDKYSAMLQELERHTEKNHPDRGDTQRSVSVYREISERCASTRKQRELALHVLTSGIKGWEGEELNTLGDILHVGPVTLAVGTERRDRYFVLFPMTLLVLSTSPRMSSFVYEGKLPLTGIDVMAVADTEDVRNAFEISGPMIESIAVSCPSRDERQQWIELLSQEENTVPRTAEIPCHVSLLATCRGPVYGRLSRHYARLVRKKIISPELVKRLLYLQYVYKPDLSAVRMRKRNEITTYAIFPKRRSSENASSVEDADELILAIPEVREKRSIMKSTIMLDVRYAWDQEETTKTQLSFPGGGNDDEEAADVLPAASRSLPGHVSGERMLRDEAASDDFEHWSEALESWRSCRTVTNLVAIDEDQPIKQTGSGDLLTFPATSQHSLDSGMAESCRMNSTDLNSACYRYRHRHGEDRQNGGFLTSDTESDNYEHQCICSSPFGSTPRTSGKNLIANAESHYSPSTTSGQPEVPANVATRNLRANVPHDKRNTVPLLTEVKNNRTRPGRYATSEEKNTQAGAPPSQGKIYTSGLYAHWWLKKDIPGISAITEQGKLPIAWLTSNQSNGKGQSSGVEHCSSPGIKTPWSLASLRPAPPLYSLKIYGKSDNAEAARTPRTLNERQFEDDAIILKVIEGYCLTVNARFTVHSALLDNETTYITRDDSLSVMNSRVDRWDSCEDRSLSETVETLKANIADLQLKMSQITSQLDEERRSRQLLATLVKRNIASQDAALVP